MLVSGSGATVVDSGGHTAPAALWVCDTASGRTRHVAVDGAGWVAVRGGSGHLFAVEHHRRRGVAAVSVRSLDAPEEVVASVVEGPDGWTYAGDAQAWAAVPRAYRDENAVLVLDAAAGSVARQACAWFGRERYDTAYQAVYDVAEVPGGRLLLVSVARDSEPVLHDPATGQAAGKLRLTGRGGNANLRFRRTAPELWADDYDTLVKLSAGDWTVLAAIQLQPAGTTEVAGRVMPFRQFIGEFVFSADEALCAVARPYSGDVLLLDTTTFQVTHRVTTGRQPLRAALLPDGRVVARDWKSGELLLGRDWGPFSL